MIFASAQSEIFSDDFNFNLIIATAVLKAGSKVPGLMNKTELKLLNHKMMSLLKNKIIEIKRSANYKR